MEVYRNVDSAFNSCYEFSGNVRRDEACHIFDTKGVASPVLQFNRHFGEPLDSMDRAGCITNDALNYPAEFFYGTDGGLHVSDIVQSVENTEYIYPVFNGKANELANDVVSIVPVSNQVLPA